MNEKRTRRQFVKTVGGVTAFLGPSLTSCTGITSRADRKHSDIRIEEISFRYDEHVFRAPVGFARAVVNRATVVTVNCSVSTAGGKIAKGFGAMPFNHTFSFPSKALSSELK